MVPRGHLGDDIAALFIYLCSVIQVREKLQMFSTLFLAIWGHGDSQKTSDQIPFFTEFLLELLMGVCQAVPPTGNHQS